MQNRDGHQKGAQRDHAEGQHGKKTHSAFLDGLHGRHGGSEESEGRPQGAEAAEPSPSGEPVDGHHRLFEDRQQHDEAEKNSEARRLARELERGGGRSGDDAATRGDAPGGHQ